MASSGVEIGRIDILLAKYFSGQANAAELAELETWMAASDDNRRYVTQLGLIWKECGNIVMDNRPNVNAALSQFRERVAQVQAPIAKMWRWWAAAAATGIIFIITLLTINNNRKGENKSPKFITINASGEGLTDSLPDGSIVSLSPYGELVYPAEFDHGRRELKLKGDAFFSVFHDASKPFRVVVKDITVTVLGTSFAVKDSVDGTMIAVKTGLVEVDRQGRNIKLSAHEKLLLPAVGPWIKMTDSFPVHPTIPKHIVKKNQVQVKDGYEQQLYNMRSILDDLVKERVVRDRSSIDWVALTDSVLIVNGELQPARLHEKLHSKYLVEFGQGYYYGPVQVTGMGYFFDKKEVNQ